MEKENMSKTEIDYLNAEKYPLTSQKGLSLEGQHLIDAFRYDAYAEKIENGEKLGDGEVEFLVELHEKMGAAGYLPDKKDGVDPMAKYLAERKGEDIF